MLQQMIPDQMAASQTLGLMRLTRSQKKGVTVILHLCWKTLTATLYFCLLYPVGSTITLTCPRPNEAATNFSKGACRWISSK